MEALPDDAQRRRDEATVAAGFARAHRVRAAEIAFWLLAFRCAVRAAAAGADRQ
jgi:hypothetical protein